MRLVTLLMLITSVFAKGQNLANTKAFADSLFEQNQFSAAIDTYKRVLFFDENERFAPVIYRNIADALYQTQRYAEAAYYYDLAYFVHQGEAQADIALQKASCLLVNGDVNLAKVELLELPEDLNPAQTQKKIFYEAMVAFASAEYEESERLFKMIAKDTLQITELFNQNQKINKINPKKAKILSIIMPGLGQFYVGDVKNGLNSLLLTGGLFYLGLRSAINTSLIDAGISVLPWFQRYYTGGFKKAEVIAEAKIKEKRYKVYNKILDEVAL